MAAAVLSDVSQTQDGVGEPNGILGAVLRAAGAPGPVQLAPGGPLLATTLEDSRTVLTSPLDYVLPFDVSRQRIRRDQDDRKPTPPLSPSAVARGRQTFADELASAAPTFTGPDLDTLVFLRTPVARATTAALLPEAGHDSRNQVGALVLAWIDSLAPVIGAARAPRRFSKPRRAEQRARRLLIGQLEALGCEDSAARATMLAAGIQVPIAAGAWCLTMLAGRPDLVHGLRTREELVLPVVWETIRLFPPSWLLPRITTREVRLGRTTLPAYTALVVSPLALGRLPDLVPGPEDGGPPLDEYQPARWLGAERRPGAWLPFGAGQHACPGRNLGLAQLTHLVSWASDFDLASPGPPAVDTSRGLSPDPSRISVLRRSASPA